MRKRLIVIPVFFFVLSVLYAQNAESPVQGMDIAVRAVTQDLNRKLVAVKAEKIVIGQFTYRGSIPLLGQYWMNQLTEELVNTPNKAYMILSGRPSGAELTVSGEIVDAADKIRIYTRLVRSDNQSIEAAFHSDFKRDQQITQMLSSGDSRSSSSYVPIDDWEPDSMENPVPKEIGDNDSNAPVMTRTIHDKDDQDFFLLIPDRDGRLMMETTGNLDTYMEFYDADTGRKLAENDDGGSGYNAKIRHSVQAGHRYIAKVRGCDSPDTGYYSFRAVFETQPDEYEPDDDSDHAKWIEPGVPQQHTFHNGDDVDWVKFQINKTGHYTIRARGLNTNGLDTCIELFDEDLNSIGEDDDGGEGYSSRLSLRLNTGLYYLKVYCLDDDPDQPYCLCVEADPDHI